MIQELLEVFIPVGIMFLTMVFIVFLVDCAERRNK